MRGRWSPFFLCAAMSFAQTVNNTCAPGATGGGLPRLPEIFTPVRSAALRVGHRAATRMGPDRISYGTFCLSPSEQLTDSGTVSGLHPKPPLPSGNILGSAGPESFGAAGGFFSGNLRLTPNY